MSLLEAYLLADTGMLTLIWITELISYPSFKEMSTVQLRKWHPQYTQRISYLVALLMFAEGVFGAAQLYVHFNGLSLLAFLLILGCFALSFFQAVPLHNQIDRGEQFPEAVNALLRKNKLCTICWSLIFVVGVVELWMN